MSRIATWKFYASVRCVFAPVFLNVFHVSIDCRPLSEQFTLYAVLKGNKPDFHQSMRSESSLSFFNSFVEGLGNAYQSDLVKG